MPRYWVISPYHADKPELWEKVWKFDLEHGLISIGWRELGDFSSLDEDNLRALIERTYPDKPPQTQTLTFNMLWAFYHVIQPGDIVIARRGRKRIAAVGTALGRGYYAFAKNASASGPDNSYSNHIDVQWHEGPKDKIFPNIVFGMHTLSEISEEKFKELSGIEPPTTAETIEEGVTDQAEFVLEKYLEDFIVTNFDAIFKGQLVLYHDPKEDASGQQYTTDVGVIDILAQESKTNCFVVIELKKGRESDRVIGQLLRYMGWVSDNLCTEGQSVKGIVVCREADSKLSYAVKMTSNVAIKYYKIDFRLADKL
jgi:restriction system protein